MPTGGNGSLRLAISAKASSPASSSMYLRVRPGVDTGRRAAQAGCGVTLTALDKGKRSRQAPTRRRRTAARAEGVPSTHTRSP